MKSLKLKILLILISIILIFTVSQINNIYKDKFITNELQISLKELKTNYEIINHNYKSSADALFHSISRDKKYYQDIIICPECR